MGELRRNFPPRDFSRREDRLRVDLLRLEDFHLPTEHPWILLCRDERPLIWREETAVTGSKFLNSWVPPTSLKQHTRSPASEPVGRAIWSTHMLKNRVFENSVLDIDG